MCVAALGFEVLVFVTFMASASTTCLLLSVVCCIIQHYRHSLARATVVVSSTLKLCVEFKCKICQVLFSARLCAFALSCFESASHTQINAQMMTQASRLTTHDRTADNR